MDTHPTQCALVVPCYNEEKRLQTATFLDFARENSHYSFVFVNDGSRDRTREVLAQLVERLGTQGVLLDNPVNQGKAEVVRQGVLWAMDNTAAAAVGFWDADLATPLPEAVEMMSILASLPHLWMVFGARVQLLGRRIERQAHRHYLGRVFATVASNLLRLAIYDTQCGAKLFRRTPHNRALFAKPFLSRWIFDVEILARLLSLPASLRPRPEEVIYEYPLRAWIDVAGSKVKPTDFFKAMYELSVINRTYLRQR